jgi:AraC-like DNA-binding protein
LLPFEQIQPVVELAGFYAPTDFQRHVYRNPAHHFLLVDFGRIESEAPGNRFIADAGELICFRPAERNEYSVHAPAAFYQAVIQFAPPPRHRATPVWDDVGPLPVHLPLGEHAAAMRQQFETLCIELPRPASIHRMRICAAVFEMLAIITRAMASSAATRQPIRHPIPDVAHDPWHRVRLMMESQLDEHDLRVDRLAQQMGMSVNHFIRSFRRHFGVTPKAYHTRVRLREGARLLREGKRSVKSIAYALGFSDSKAFARRFRHHFGVRPSDVRMTIPEDADGDARKDDAGIDARGRHDLFYGVNQHVLPPHAGKGYLNRYLLPRKAR